MKTLKTKKSVIRLIAGLLFFSFASSVMAQKTEHTIKAINSNNYISFGELRGYLEPCGCDPTSDLGGVKRIQAILKKGLTINKLSLVIDTGNNFPPSFLGTQISDDQKIKLKYLAEALYKNFKVDFRFLNAIELKMLHSKELSKYIKDNQNNWYLGNLKSTEIGSLKISSHLNLRKYFVTGYLSPSLVENNPDLITMSPDLIERWKKEKSKNSSLSYSILIFAGNDEELSMVNKANIFDEIIVSNRTSLNAIVDNSEKKNPSSLYLKHGDKFFRQIPVGGQGVWIRGFSGEQREKLKPLSSLIARPSSASNLSKRSDIENLFGVSQSANGEILSYTDPDLIWLDPSWGQGVDLDSLLARYNKELKNNFQRQENFRIAQAKESLFVGANSCKNCHADAYGKWLESKHATALDSLTEKRKDQDGECVSCHVVGLGEGGFVSKTKSPHLSHVQCENCHGPRKKHIENPYEKLPQDHAKESCVSCHQGMHSPNFEYQSYWKQIEHK